MSNSIAVLVSIPKLERAKVVKDLDLSNDALPEENPYKTYRPMKNKSCKCQESMFWIDSVTVLRYIDSENIEFKPFVTNSHL